jgi:uncharacterized protein (TIGR02001 family)
MRRAVLALAGVLPAHVALAQVSAEVSVATDNEYRGVSLNDKQPAPAVDLAYDSSAGWFAGTFASQVRFYAQDHSSLEMMVDAGYARKTASGLSWELGATSSIFPDFAFYNYSEVFAGLSSNDWSARVYYAPDYFGRNWRTLYAEFNYAHPLSEHLRLLGHVGILQGTFKTTNASAHTLDASVGIAAKLADFNIQLAWAATNRANYLYPVMVSDTRHEWVLSIAYSY